jgi:hypothetical protein
LPRGNNKSREGGNEKMRNKMKRVKRVLKNLFNVKAMDETTIYFYDEQKECWVVVHGYVDLDGNQCLDWFDLKGETTATVRRWLKEDGLNTQGAPEDTVLIDEWLEEMEKAGQ